MSGPHADDPISYYGTGREEKPMGATHSTWYMGQALQPSDRAHWEGISTGKGKGKSHRARTPAKPSDPGDDAPTEPASPEADPG